MLTNKAHWETKGTRVTNMIYPRTIHDFGGFPKALFDVQYPAKGSPELAFEIRKDLTKTEVQFDENWGLDHGAWSVLKHLYPLADVPVIQMSLDVNLSPQGHYDVAKQLEGLRRKGILIIGSGNMIHNLGMVHWQKLNEIGFAYDWAIEAREKMNHFILNDDYDSLIHYKNNGQSFKLSIPTPEHYIPLLYVLALKEKIEDLQVFP